MVSKVISFTQLDAWKESHSLVIAVFRSCETINRNHAVKSQIERSVLSVSSNISEGFGRDSTKDKIHFYIMARGSLYEMQNQLLVLRDLGLINNELFGTIAEQTVVVQRLLHGLIRSTKKRTSS